MEEIKVGEYGLEESTEGMYIRTSNGIIGKIINANSDEMLNGPEILSKNKGKEIVYVIERDSIVDIRDGVISLLRIGDFINVKDENLEEGYLVLDNESWLDKVKLELSNEYWKLISIVTKEQLELVEYEV